MTDRAGQQFGNYRLLRLLGRGGFAEVYLGQHVRLASQQAAIKILSTHLNETDMRAFEQEAEVIASLVHPHIVRVLDFDVAEGIPFLVMDYAPNGSLRQRHHLGEQVPLSTVISYVQQVADGLQYAHDQKRIHRDIKPDNMLVGRRGEILLSDFGIATIAHSTTSQSAQAAIGTIPYMAPEQMQEHPRPASDQYALAITVYEWLTGERPFTGSFTEVAVKHAMIPPPPLRTKRPELSLQLEQIVLTALAKDPKTRFENVQAFAKALEQASQSPSFARIQVPQPEIATKTVLAPTQPAVFPSTNGISVPSYGPNAQGIEINNQQSGSVNSVAWSPDSKRIVSASDDGTVHVWNAANGKQIFLYQGHSDAVNSVAWSPNGKRIATASDDQTIQVWNAFHGQKPLTYRKHTSSVWSVAWSPDSQWLASASTDETVQVWNAMNGRKIFKHFRHLGPVFSVAWSPDGQWIASASDNNTIQIWNATNGEYAFSFQKHVDAVTDMAWSPDSQWLASASDDNTVIVWNVANGECAFTYQEHSNYVESVTWSPDGQWIASASGDTTVQIWSATNGACAFKYQAHKRSVSSVDWSPDGQQIVSASDDGIVHIWRVFSPGQ